MNIELISSENINKELAYLLGVYLTDGYISEENKFILQVIDEDFAKQTLACIKKIKPNCNANVWERMNSKGKWNKNKQYCISAGFTGLKEFFEKQTNKKHHIPYVIWDAPLQIKKWFIAGVMDGDGYVCMHKNPKGMVGKYKIGIGKSEHGWILEFKELLQKMRIDTGKIQRSLTKNKVPFANFTFVHNSFITNGLFFTIKRKQDRIKKIINIRSETIGCESERIMI